jgi:hypothetical protein
MPNLLVCARNWCNEAKKFIAPFSTQRRRLVPPSYSNDAAGLGRRARPQNVWG